MKISKLLEEIKQKTKFYQESLKDLQEKEKIFDEGEFGSDETSRLSSSLSSGLNKGKH